MQRGAIARKPAASRRPGCAIAGLILALAALAATASAQPAPAEFEAIRAADLQLASIGYRLSTANAGLCDRLEPGIGIQLHSLDQYAPDVRDAARTHFGFRGAIAAEGIVAGSPAERSGVRADDTILSIGQVNAPAAPVSAEASTRLLDSFSATVARLPPAAPLAVALRRPEGRIELTIHPVPACRTRYELRIADSFDARANGELVQITSKYLDAVDSELLPAVVAHELAHNILRHRARLDAAGADFGLASGFGRNVGLFRQTEIEADILSVHLLARAGYPLEIAERFWREVGPKLIAGMIRSRSHPPFKDRAATVAAEAARIAAAGPGAPLPEFYARRGEPLDGEWKKLLVRAP